MGGGRLRCRRGRRALATLLTGALLSSAGLFAAVAADPPVAGAAPPDGRGWEMVSPVDMNGGDVEAPGVADGAAVQAAAAGGAVAFGSPASFGAAVGAAPASQYLATRGATAWSTANLTPPLLSGTYAGGAYQAFAPNLERALLGSGWRCRDGGTECVAANPPLAAGAPAGYRNLYLEEGGRYTPLVTAGDAPGLAGVDPASFRPELAGASPDLRHAVISTCAALTPDAVEVAAGPGCDPAAANLYEWSAGGGLEAVNVLPGEGQTAPGAALAAPGAGAISADGSRVYWQGADGDLYLRQGGVTTQVDAGAGGGGSFQAASSTGAVVYFLAGGELQRFVVATAATTDLGPALGVLGTSSDGSVVYYLTADGLYLRRGSAAPVQVAGSADLSNVPAATGTARVSADGTRLAFLSSQPLLSYPNAGRSEVYLYDATRARLRCVSCNPRGAAPVGPSSIPGARAAGEGPATYKPRVLSDGGTRIFFDSGDVLVPADSDGAPDVYEWEENGTGGCASALGCLELVSGGRTGSASFLDASADGEDVFFRTDASLVPLDTGAFDVYDARVGGGFPEPEPAIPCDGDACQGPASVPDQPQPLTALLAGPPNPPLHFKPQKQKGKKKKGKHRKHAGKGKKGKHQHKKHAGKGKRGKGKKKGGRR